MTSEIKARVGGEVDGDTPKILQFWHFDQSHADQWGSSLIKTQLKNQWSIETDGDLGHIKHRVRHPALSNETGGGQTCWAIVVPLSLLPQCFLRSRARIGSMVPMVRASDRRHKEDKTNFRQMGMLRWYADHPPKASKPHRPSWV